VNALGQRQASGWVGASPVVVVRCDVLDPLLAGLPFYTSRHDQDARWRHERFDAIAGQKAHDGISEDSGDRSISPFEEPQHDTNRSLAFALAIARSSRSRAGSESLF
jgi:hypothetical protein